MFLTSPSYPLDEALRVFGNADLVDWLDQNQNSPNDDLRLLWSRRRSFLEKSLIPDIRTGALVATAFQKPLSMESKRTQISPDVWELMTIDYTMCTAQFDSLSLTRIEVRENLLLAQVYGRQAATRPSFLDKILDDSASDAQTDQSSSVDIEISLSDDLEVLTIGETRWRFKGEIQQAIIKQLVDAYPETLKSLKVLLHAGSNVDTIAKAFNGSPNWPTLKLYIARDDGTCRLLAVPQAEGDSERQETPPDKNDTGPERHVRAASDQR